MDCKLQQPDYTRLRYSNTTVYYGIHERIATVVVVLISRLKSRRMWLDVSTQAWTS